MPSRCHRLSPTGPGRSLVTCSGTRATGFTKGCKRQTTYERARSSRNCPHNDKRARPSGPDASLESHAAVVTVSAALAAEFVCSATRSARRADAAELHAACAAARQHSELLNPRRDHLRGMSNSGLQRNQTATHALLQSSFLSRRFGCAQGCGRSRAAHPPCRASYLS
jgi:hypothetical protein